MSASGLSVVEDKNGARRFEQELHYAVCPRVLVSLDALIGWFVEVEPQMTVSCVERIRV